ncbi:hypothetical protein ISN76_06525 [Dyella halodurans]|uniref:Uncharacterized protein n=1 Tax=Dyella halodurans TaxID=1920171 RepID=A0ABV9C4C0_9GAMM|nr:hypothetical protein [Dyella halodurans]
MNTSRFSTLAASSHKHIVARALILALGLVGTPLLAGQTVDPNGPSHAPSQRRPEPASHSDDQRIESGSRINGRLDWDVDYPSQLAPPERTSPRDAGAVVSLTAPACSAADECAP